jgi:hypothetical protein
MGDADSYIQNEKLAYSVQMVTEQTSATDLFTIWLDEMEITTDQAAKALGKTKRMVEYYASGYPVPDTVQLLMDALHQGYRPRKWAERLR